MCNPYNTHIYIGKALFENRLYDADSANFVHSCNSCKIAGANIPLSGYLFGEKEKE